MVSFFGDEDAAPNRPEAGGSQVGMTASGFDEPEVYYDADGNAMYWNGFTFVPAGFTDSAQAAGYQAPARLSQSSSYNVSQSLQDPNALALERDALNQRIRESDQQMAIDQEKLQFQRDIARVEAEQGNKRLEMEAMQLAESIQARLDRTTLEREQMAQDMLQLDRQITAQTQRDAAQMAFEGQQSEADRRFRAGESAATRQFQGAENEADRALSRETSMRTDATRRAEAAAQFAANGATDFGRLSAFLGNGGLSGLSTAIGQGQTAITDQSLEPLAALMQAYPTGGSGGPRPIAAATGDTPWDAQKISDVNTRIQNQFVDAVGSGAMGSTTIAPNAEDEARLRSMGITTLSDHIANFGGGGSAVTASTDNGVTTLRPGEEPVRRFNQGTGGWIDAPEQFIAGDAPTGDPHGLEEAVEVRDPEGNAEIRVTPGMLTQLIMMLTGSGQGQHAMPDGTLMADSEMPADKGTPKYAFGTGVISSALEAARKYQQTAGEEALRRSGMSTVPTPVQFSNPGEDPTLQNLGASVAAVTRGIPRASFLNELLKLTPRGMAFNGPRRTY